MALILAIEPDKKQASAVRSLARGSLQAQMLVADSTPHGLQQLEGRVPDLILTSLLLSPKDESALDEYLRALDADGHRVPTLVIPVLGPIGRSKGGLLTRLKKPKKTTGTEGCDPQTFAEQITAYLDRAAAERALDEDEDDDELPIAASARRVAIRPDQHRAPPEPLEPSFEAAPASVFGRIATSEPRASQREAVRVSVEQDLPEPTPEPVPQERILKDPFSIEGLHVPGSHRGKTAPEPVQDAEPAATWFPDVVGSAGDEVPAGVAAPSFAAASSLAPFDTYTPDEDEPWNEITLETSESLEITAEPIDLNAFVQELEAVASSYETPKRNEAIVARTEPIADAPPWRPAQKPDLPLGLATRYAWPVLEGLPSGIDWEIVRPGDLDYELVANFIAAFEPSAAPSRSRPFDAPAAPAAETAAVKPVPAPKSVDRESWASLTMRLRYNWPSLEGIECVDLLAELEPDDTGLYTITDPEPSKPKPKPSLLRPERSVKAAPIASAAGPATDVEPAAKAAARVEPVRPAVRIEGAVKGATPIAPAPKTVAVVAQPPKPAQSVAPPEKPAPAAAPAAKPAAPVMQAAKAAPAVSPPRAVTPPPPVPRTAAPAVVPVRRGARIEPAVKTVSASRPSPLAGSVVRTLNPPQIPAPEIAAASMPPAAPAPAATPPAAQWLEILSAIRHDIQELRAEHRVETLDTSNDTTAERNGGAPQSARSKGVPPASADDAVTRIVPAKARKAQTAAAALPVKPARKRKRPTPPKQDEWGFFDPDQCGFAALLAKLEEIDGDEPAKP